MKKVFLAMMLMANAALCLGQSKVYVTREISPESLVKIYCHFYTPQHPFDYEQRRKPVERSLPIKIGADTWIGGNVTICPGVTIGERCIVGAGSVVTHDVESGTMVAGNPAKVIRKLK